MAARLFVGNLSYEATEADLRTLFSEIGPVTMVHLPLDRESGRPRGFGFVEFAEPSLGAQAIERFDQKPFKGRPLAVNEATPRGEAGRGPSRAGSHRAAPPGRPSSGGAPPRGPSQAAMAPPEPEGPGPRFESGPRRARSPGSFGPDAAPRHKRRRGRGDDRSPRGPLKELGGRPHDPDFYNDDDDADDVPFWAAHDALETDEE
ncbi:MAG: RNA recognition motif domain-containing protein [Myxococcota bacterium]